MTDRLLHLYLHLQLHRRTLLWLNIKSQKKIGEEIVARHLKEEEKINLSLDHDLDQETDLYRTIEKNQRKIKEKDQDPH